MGLIALWILCLAGGAYAEGSGGSPVYRPSDRIVNIKRSSSDDEPLQWNFSGGVDFLYPFARAEYAIGEKYTVGLMPSYFHYSYSGLTTSLLGGYVTLAGYGDALFRGFWCQLGLGAFSSSTSYAGVSASQLAFSAMASAGYRFFFPGGFNLGVAGGAEYYDLSKTYSLPRSYFFVPLALVEAGFAF
jgi:hypothetical protein